MSTLSRKDPNPCVSTSCRTRSRYESHVYVLLVLQCVIFRCIIRTSLGKPGQRITKSLDISPGSCIITSHTSFFQVSYDSSVFEREAFSLCLKALVGHLNVSDGACISNINNCLFGECVFSRLSEPLLPQAFLFCVWSSRSTVFFSPFSLFSLSFVVVVLPSSS